MIDDSNRHYGQGASEHRLAVLVVELAEQEGLLTIGNVEDCALEALEIGMALEVIPGLSVRVRALAGCDCDLPVDVCGAVVVTTAERAKGLRHRPVHVSAVSTGTGPRPDMIFWHDYDERAYAWAARTLWRNAGLGPDDMGFAMLYDGSPPWCSTAWRSSAWCPRARPAPSSGGHLAGGSLPLNPHGGNNSEGRSHGIGHVVEAVLQLQGRAGERQLPEVRAPPSSTAGPSPSPARWCSGAESDQRALRRGVASSRPRQRLDLPPMARSDSMADSNTALSSCCSSWFSQ